MKNLLFISAFVCYSSVSNAQLTLTAPNQLELIDFTGFDGSGFSPAPSAGQLSSNTWALNGMSDGTLNFGGTATAGDFARGISTGSETFGGVYAFDHGSGDAGLGVQPTGSDFYKTTDHITLRIVNGMGIPASQFAIGYEIWNYNDEGRANAFNFSYSANGVVYTTVPALNYVSPEVADGTPVWSVTTRSTLLTNFYIAAGDTFYVRWSGGDISGAGSRDEFALDNIQITAEVDDITAAFSYSEGCLGDPTDFTDLSTTINGNITGWEWDFGDGNTANSTNPQHTYAAAGTYNVRLMVTNSAMQSDTVTTTVVIQAIANPVIAQPLTTCATGAPFKINASIAGGVWQGSGFENDSTGGYFDPSIHGAGTYTITYTIGGLCGGNDTAVVMVDPTPDAEIALQDDTVCAEAAVITLQTVQTGGAWSLNALNGLFDPAAAGTGTHLIRYQIEMFGCLAADTVFITVLEQADASIVAVGSLCTDGSPVLLSGVSDNTGIWSGAGVTANIFNPGAAGSGTHVITYSIGGDCGDTQTAEIVVNVASSVSVTPSDSAICGNGTMFILPQGSPVGGSWSGNGITNAATGAFDPSSLSVGMHTVYYTYTANGCSSVDSIDFTIHAYPTAAFTETITGATLSLNNTSTGATTYAWNFGDGSGSSTLSSPSYQYTSSGTYTVTLIAMNASGCADTATSSVNVNVVGIAQLNSSSAHAVFPNPVAHGETVKITGVSSIIPVVLCSAEGRSFLRYTDESGFLATDDLSAGIYLIQLTGSEGQSVSKRLVVVR